MIGCANSVSRVVSPVAPVVPVDTSALYYPAANFEQNVTLKPFGIYVTPKNSPVQPEIFTGYHSGVDMEVPKEKQSEDILVYSIADGEILLARFAGGYGGVVAIRHEIEGKTYVAIYGHLRISSFKFSVGDKVKAGEMIAVLGKGYSKETDGERENLHFGMHIGNTVDIKGYVSKKSDLDSWIDPIVFLKNNGAVTP